MKIKGRGVTLFELIVTLTVITAVAAVIFLSVSNVLSTDKVKAQALMQHVNEIELAVGVFIDDTGCHPRAINDLLDEKFFEFEGKVVHSYNREPCRADIKYRAPWNGPYYPKENYIECHPRELETHGGNYS